MEPSLVGSNQHIETDGETGGKFHLLFFPLRRLAVQRRVRPAPRSTPMTNTGLRGALSRAKRRHKWAPSRGRSSRRDARTLWADQNQRVGTFLSVQPGGSFLSFSRAGQIRKDSGENEMQSVFGKYAQNLFLRPIDVICSDIFVFI